MPRIAYLTRRGNIWWFRRRHPVISFQTSQNHQRSVVCVDNRKKAQATGHTALSLQTTSKREARQLSAQASADFERAWGLIEAHMTEENAEQDMLDGLAMAITISCRKNIGVLRSSPAAMQDPRVKEKAYQILEQELRSALGVTMADATPVASSNFTGAVPASQADDPYDGSQTTDADDLAAIEAEMGEYEQHTLLSHIGPSARTNDDYYAEHLIREFSIHTMAFRTTFSEYLEACDKLGVDPRKATPDFELAIKEALKSARELGLAQDEVAKHLANGSAPSENSVVSNQLFTSFAEDYLDKRCAGYRFRHEDETPHENIGAKFIKSSLGNWKAAVRIFTEIVGDLPLKDFTKDHILEFNSFVQRLPNNYGKSAKDKRTIRELVEGTEQEEERKIPALIEELSAKGLPQLEISDRLAKARIKRISANTIKKHQSALSSIFARAVELRAIPVNPFKGRTLTKSDIEFRQETEIQLEREGWGDHIYALFGSEKFQRPLTDIGDPMFWAPLLAAFTGMRMEETLQLRLADFQTEDRIHYVAVQNSGGTQSIKTKSGVRKIPLHSALLDLGLLQLVELRASQGMGRLFPDLSLSKSKGTLSGILSKNFAYYLKSRGIKQDGLDFHCLRTDFHVRLSNAQVPEHVRKRFMGHKLDDVTNKHYLPAGERMENLKEYIDRIDTDYSGIRHPFGKPKAAKPTKLRVVGDD